MTINENKKTKESFLEDVFEKIKEKFSEKESHFIRKFALEFFSNIALEDLFSFKTDDLFGMILSFWKIMTQSKEDQVYVRVFNPCLEIQGWESKHTVIEILTQDKPFLVDSILMEIERNQHALVQNIVITCGGLKVERVAGKIVGVWGHAEKVPHRKDKTQSILTEYAPIHIQMNRQSDRTVLATLKLRIEAILNDVDLVVRDWQPMLQLTQGMIESLKALAVPLQKEHVQSTCDFLDWIVDNHFTFLGYRKFVFDKDKTQLLPEAGSGLGILRGHDTQNKIRSLASMPSEAAQRMCSNEIMLITKTNTPSTIHRPVYTDRLWIKYFNADCDLVGVHELIGLYTAVAYNTNPCLIPHIRDKINAVMRQSKIKLDSHFGKALWNIIETLPREDLFQGSTGSLLNIARGILQLQERRNIRLFHRFDLFGQFISCLVFIPREKFNTELRMAFQAELEHVFGSNKSTYFTRFSDSVLIRTHFVIRTTPDRMKTVNFEDLEQRLVALARSWDDELRDACFDSFGEEQGHALYTQYRHAFSKAYQESVPARNSVYDIRAIRALNDQHCLKLNFYQRVDAKFDEYMFKVYQIGASIPLSDVIPILEKMGLRVIHEQGYQVRFVSDKKAYINDFSLQLTQSRQINLSQVRDNFQEAFEKIWFSKMEDDGFNRLILLAGLNWREVLLLRTYAAYLKQTGFTFSQLYIQDTLVSYSEIVWHLLQLFHFRFDPEQARKASKKIEKTLSTLEKLIDSVISLDHDKILRRYLEVILATVRTNYYQVLETGEAKPYISLKFSPEKIKDLPLPKPKFEIFVYSPQFEGVHLRNGKIARGGLRWSDRKEDFRTEILSLMKAQNVKNAVIVPAGAKGGFITKKTNTRMDRETLLKIGVACYQNFIRGLLDLSDNMVGDQSITPENCVIYDEPDAYLVVAADKGTATFSDYANQISKEYDFWLGDAFASGGSVGYDHKKMGITARGAWVSVKRHFRELGIDTQSQSFTVVGIGDMAGDVFGNGMLLSEYVQLIAAFNHMHIFVDPNPSDSRQSYLERKRLFELPRSTWADYNRKLISAGGGVYERAAKTIKVTPEMQKRFKIEHDYLSPNELIREILKAPIDLLWNGGIGTFIKSAKESEGSVEDRANDGIRINADEVQFKVIGEGGNLGLTQLARAEYTFNGGKVYSDFIDNSAGVDCSDHEVNIKILLNDIVTKGDLTLKQRNHLLLEMTDEVAHIVLSHNYRQTQAISVAVQQASRNLELHARFMRSLEKKGLLDRTLEFLPNDKVLNERKIAGRGMMAPGIAILISYGKIKIKNDILDSDIPEDPYLSKFLYEAFPKQLQTRYETEINQHPLRRELIATHISNALVNEVGFSFVYRLFDETGASTPAIIRAFIVIRDLFELEKIWVQIESLDNHIQTSVQYEMYLQYIRLIRRSTRWLLKNYRLHLNIKETLKDFKKRFAALKSILFQCLSGEEETEFNTLTQKFINQGVARQIAENLGLIPALMSSFDIMIAARESTYPIDEVAKAYFIISDQLQIGWIRKQIIAHTVESNWDVLIREGLRDDLDWQQRALTIGILDFYRTYVTIDEDLKHWKEKYTVLVKRWQIILRDLQSLSKPDFTIFYVAIRELLDLTQTCAQHDTVKINCDQA